MHPGGGRFPRGIESRERGTSPQVGFDPAHFVVGRGAHRYEVARDVQTKALAGGKDPREALADIFALPLRHIAKVLVGLGALPLSIDVMRDEVTCANFPSFVEGSH